jgi:ABC-type bacteriocin/lantibiotic exporter with double-glycine peptidase domain
MCYSWSLTLITSSGLVLIIGTYVITTPPLVKRLNEVQHADIQASTTANEVFSSIRMVAACGAEEKMAGRYAKWVDESRRRGLKMSPIIAIQQAPSEIHGPSLFEWNVGQMLTRFPLQFSLPCTGRLCLLLLASCINEG